MTQNPFAKRRPSREVGADNRRSTRVDFVCRIVVSGRDSTGQTFREETETSTVNLHGCRLRLNHEVLVGMVVTLESPHVQSPAKAICVHVWDAATGQTAHEIAVQLLKPQNLWGLKNPPADWQQAAERPVQVTTTRPQSDATAVTAAKPAIAPAPAPPEAPPSPSSAGVSNRPAPISTSTPKLTPAAANPAKPTASPAAVISRPPPAPPNVTANVPAAATPKRDASPAPANFGAPSTHTTASAAAGSPRLGELEDRSWQLMDSVLQTLRDQAEELVRGTLEEFRQQVQALVRDAEECLKRRTEESYAEVESSVNTLRGDLADQLTHRAEEIVVSAREALHARVEEMFSTMLSSSQGKVAKPSSHK